MTWLRLKRATLFASLDEDTAIEPLPNVQTWVNAVLVLVGSFEGDHPEPPADHCTPPKKLKTKSENNSNFSNGSIAPPSKFLNRTTISCWSKSLELSGRHCAYSFPSLS